MRGVLTSVAREDQEESVSDLKLHVTNAAKPIRSHLNRRRVDQCCAAIALVLVERHSAETDPKVLL